MNQIPTDIQVFDHLIFPDTRGYLKCIYESDKTETIEGFSCKISNSLPNVARGIHWQNQLSPQIKVITLLKGSIKDFLINLDKNSKDFGKLFCFDLSANSQNHTYSITLWPWLFSKGRNDIFLFLFWEICRKK